METSHVLICVTYERSKTLSQNRNIFVLDTSVLLSEGSKALRSYGQDEVVIPLVVIEELEGKRNEPIIGRFARDVLRTLEELSNKDSGHINTGTVVNSPNGTVRIEINHVHDITWLPDSYKHDRRNDTRIITVAGNLLKEGNDVTLVSKDLSLRLKANVLLPELKTSGYQHKESVSGSTTGVKDIYVYETDIADFHKNGKIDFPITDENLPANMGVIMSAYGNERHTSLGIKNSKNVISKFKEDRILFGMKPRSGQKLAAEYLMNQNIQIVSIGGKAGTGKTLLAVSAALEQTVESSVYHKVKVFRPLYAVGGQDLGFLPGTEEEKMDPWGAAIFDAIEDCKPHTIDMIREQGKLEILPITHIRGRTFNNTFIIVDEAQNLDTLTLLTIISRVGQNSKIVLCWDGAQRDNHLIDRNDGIVTVIDILMKQELFAHISLLKSERSIVAGIASDALEQYLG